MQAMPGQWTRWSTPLFSHDSEQRNLKARAVSPFISPLMIALSQKENACDHRMSSQSKKSGKKARTCGRRAWQRHNNQDLRNVKRPAAKRHRRYPALRPQETSSLPPWRDHASRRRPSLLFYAASTATPRQLRCLKHRPFSVSMDLTPRQQYRRRLHIQHFPPHTRIYPDWRGNVLRRRRHTDTSSSFVPREET